MIYFQIIALAPCFSIDSNNIPTWNYVANCYDPKWKNEMARLEPRIGSQKAIVAIARKLLVVVWHLLTNEEADHFASPPRIARSFYALAFKIGSTNLPEKNARQYVRNQLDRLGIGQDLTRIPWGGKTVNLPPSSLPSPTLEEGGDSIQ